MRKTALTIDGHTKYSFDWQYEQLVKPGQYGYSSLTNLPDGELGLFYEGTENTEMDFMKFNSEFLTWIRDSENLKSIVDYFEKENEIPEDEAAEHLKTHLTAVSHYEEQEETEKVVEHLNGFKELLEQQNNNEMIEEAAYSALMKQTDHLIAEWK
ncbi:exo-alpha-sialidase [Salicibibacter halophilus]|uniref:Exo-alpha-sialidase n=1 Tax=Salicibibacter halophilus TaxID=2502791 RepID=A0A514LKC6_9BACI|nr:sialidase family protein [Salicibibacter halophilus]QDI92316.1 exo-alpha-sialidase [Salicibibacter halophilus]